MYGWECEHEEIKISFRDGTVSREKSAGLPGPCGCSLLYVIIWLIPVEQECVCLPGSLGV